MYTNLLHSYPRTYILYFAIHSSRHAGCRNFFPSHVYCSIFLSSPRPTVSRPQAVRPRFAAERLPSTFAINLLPVVYLALPVCVFPPLQDIVDTHPGLTFLKDAPEFHSRYITTVNCTVYITPVCLSPNAEPLPLLLFWPLREWCDSRGQLIA